MGPQIRQPMGGGGGGGGGRREREREKKGGGGGGGYYVGYSVLSRSMFVVYGNNG